MEGNNKQIIEFATKWIGVFSDEKTNNRDLLRVIINDFSEDANRLGFIMDMGEGFAQKYNVHSDKEALRILSTVDDIDCLGSLIYSQWRQDTYWAYDPMQILENKEWYSATLSRLKELANE